MTIPEMWKVIEITKEGEPPFRKVFAGWRGGYADSDRWRLNSGIESTEFDGEIYSFIGSSGSIYKCHKNLEGITGTWLQFTFEDIKQQFEELGYTVTEIDYEGDEDVSRA
jgi:hypothetical protein